VLLICNINIDDDLDIFSLENLLVA